MTTRPTIKEVEDYIEKMKQPDTLMGGCRRFHEIEPRDIAYIVCSKLISNGEASMSHILAGLRVFLQVWNAVYIQHFGYKCKAVYGRGST